jgi:hypothetical protein
MSAPVYYRSRAAEKVRLSFKILEDRQPSAGRPGAEQTVLRDLCDHAEYPPTEQIGGSVRRAVVFIDHAA